MNEGMTLEQQLWSMAAVYVVASVVLAAVFGANLVRGRKQRAGVLQAGSET